MEYASIAGEYTAAGLGGVKQTLVSGWQHLKDHIVPHERNNYHPHILGNRVMALFALLLCTVKISVLIATAFSAGIEPAYSSAITPERIIQLTNESRASLNLPALTYNQKLAQAAQNKAQDMLGKSYFAHTSPEGVSPWFWIGQQGYSYMCAGENLAVNFQESEDVETAWMNSPGHKANILSKCFEEIGIGVAQGQFEGHTAIFVVQMFGARADQPIAHATEPTKVSPPPQASVGAPTSSVGATTTPLAKVDKSKPIVQNTAPKPAPLAEEQAKTAPEFVVEPPPELKIVSHDVKIQDDSLHITVTTSEAAGTVLALYGRQGTFLRTNGTGEWTADIPFSEVVGQAVQVKARDIRGTVVTEQIANFTKTVDDTFGPAGSVHGEQITVFGKTFHPGAVEHNFYLLFIAVLLTCLAIAIAVHRHIQHVQLIANTSFVTVLALLLWIG